MEKIGDRSSSSSEVQLPPGFRFHPSDQELIVYYLNNKVTSNPLPASVVADIDLYKYNPWELPSKASFGEDEWYFFSPRDRKYPNGARPNRAAGSGYWKATGTDKPILTSCGTKSIGVKKALVFYKGRPPKGAKTEWIMHEYRLLETMIWTPKPKPPNSMRLDDWVLCRVRQKSSSSQRSGSWGDERNYVSDELADWYHVPRLNELLGSNEDDPNVNVEMAKTSYLFNDCPMLPYMFATSQPQSQSQSQQALPLPCFDTTASSISFQSSTTTTTTTTDKSCTTHSVQEANSDNSKNLQISFSSSSSLETLSTMFNNPSASKRKTSFVVHPSKKLIIREREREREEEEAEKEEVISVSKYCSDNNYNIINFYGTDHSQWNPTFMQYQELNRLDFTETHD